jgi:hypothetical protein
MNGHLMFYHGFRAMKLTFSRERAVPGVGNEYE